MKRKKVRYTHKVFILVMLLISSYQIVLETTGYSFIGFPFYYYHSTWNAISRNSQWSLMALILDLVILSLFVDKLDRFIKNTLKSKYARKAFYLTYIALVILGLVDLLSINLGVASKSLYPVILFNAVITNFSFILNRFFLGVDLGKPSMFVYTSMFGIMIPLILSFSAAKILDLFQRVAKRLKISR
ncbi:hypothetical protein IPM62_00945 [Candidatus Woesebacteria bacterium]|nr:MAG: hypothetical protein IPM62_00945 [Candidatus Woesebacteria bacterium]